MCIYIYIYIYMFNRHVHYYATTLICIIQSICDVSRFVTEAAAPDDPTPHKLNVCMFTCVLCNVYMYTCMSSI